MMIELWGKFKAICARLGLTDKIDFVEPRKQQQKPKATLEF